jgi:hypothetical protein
MSLISSFTFSSNNKGTQGPGPGAKSHQQKLTDLKGLDVTNNKISLAFYGKGDFFPLHLMSNILIMALHATLF